MKKINKKTGILLICCIGFILTGCSEVKPGSSSENTYMTQNRESTLEYSIYMNKQIQVYINEISARMTMARSIFLNRQADNEAAFTESALEKMRKVYDETSIVNPSIGAEQDRENTLRAMQTAIDHMEGYQKAVKEGSSVDGYIADFENDFNQLTGLANLYAQ